MKSALNIPWERYALIAELAHRLQGKSHQFGKTALQKLVYLLQEVYEIRCGYAFELYIYGPFTPQLMGDLDMVESLGGVQVVPAVPPTGGYHILPGHQGKVIRQRASGENGEKDCTRALELLINDFGEYSAKELELRSTIIYVARFMRKTGVHLTRDEVTDIVKDIKLRFPRKEIEVVVEELESKGFIRFDS